MKEDKLSIFFDSNVIIDALTGRSRSSASLFLCKQAILGHIKGYVATKQITDIAYVLKKYHFDGVVFFDTFPVRENPVAELQANIDMCETMLEAIDDDFMNDIQNVWDKQDAILLHKIYQSFFLSGYNDS